MRKQYRKIEEVLDSLTAIQIAAVADIYANDEKLLLKKSLDTAAKYYKMAAEMGDPYAQCILANSYVLNDTQALFWYGKSAEQGNPYAQYALGMYLSEEDGALLWLHSSAKNGFPTAMKELSDRLQATDPRKSKKWLRKYYRKKGTIQTLHGKKYMKKIHKMKMPEVLNGEVVIRI